MRYPLRIASALAVVSAGAVLAPAALGAPAPSRLEQQWSIVSGPAVKLLVNKTAWTRVGRQQLVAAGLPAGTPTNRYFQLNTDAKDDSDHFYGPTIQPGKAVSEDVSTVDPAPYGAPSLTVRLQGYSLFDHRARVKFNGSVVGTVSWFGDGAGS